MVDKLSAARSVYGSVKMHIAKRLLVMSIAIPKQYVSVIRLQPSPWRFVISRVLRLVGISHLVTMTVDPGIRLRLYPTSVSEMYWMEPHGHSDDHAVLQAWLRPGMTVVDVGANIGALTVHASKAVGASGRVVAIEAHPRTFEYLTGNLRLNDCRNVRAVHAAVGVSAGSLVFSDLKQDDVNHVIPEGTSTRPDADRYGKAISDGVEVPVKTLDTVLEGASISFLKIDVEGFELSALQGAVATLSRTDCIYIESFERSFGEFGYHTSDLVGFLLNQGLAVFSRRSGNWVAIGAEHVSTTVENLIALRDPTLIDRLAPSVK